MNILYFTYYECCPEAGGTERATATAASSLSRFYGYKVFSLYQVKHEGNPRQADFSRSIHMPQPDANAIADIIKTNEIDVIVNQECSRSSKCLRRAIENSGRVCALVYAHHSRPLTLEKTQLQPDHFFNIIRNDSLSKKIVKTISYPLYRFVIIHRFTRWFRDADRLSDAKVLLSNGFIPIWKKITKRADSSIEVVPNSLTLDFAQDTDTLLCAKEKRVLIVCRLDKHCKRVHLALEIWKRLEQNPQLKDWQLDIVGTGDHEQELKQYARENLSRVTFHGRQVPLDYYLRSSLFFMTSAYEGWGLTLTEAGQTGCVCLGFDTFEALHDIITDGENGFIIPEGDLDLYAAKATELMLDDNLRHDMAIKALEMAQRFTPEKTAAMWQRVFEKAYHKASLHAK